LQFLLKKERPNEGDENNIEKENQEIEKENQDVEIDDEENLDHENDIEVQQDTTANLPKINDFILCAVNILTLTTDLKKYTVCRVSQLRLPSVTNNTVIFQRIFVKFKMQIF
jgi:hypothetical protein